MKKVGFLFWFVLISFPGWAQYIKTLFNQEKVNGRVSAITEIQLTPKSDGTETDSLIIKRKYDNKGNTIQEIFTTISHYSPNENVFDKDGSLIKTRRRTNVSVFNYITHYMNGGKKITICRAYGEKNIYVFDKNGILKRNDEYQTDGKLVSKDLYKYDDTNRLVRLIGYTDQDSLYDQFSYIYNERNLAIEEERYYGKANSNVKIIYTYLDFDKLGNWIKRKQEEMEGKSTTDKIVIRIIKYQNKRRT